jgi:hypothetical protein
MKDNKFKRLQHRFLDELEEDEEPFGVERFLDVPGIESRDDVRHVLWEMLDRGKVRTTSDWRYELVKVE